MRYLLYIEIGSLGVWLVGVLVILVDLLEWVWSVGVVVRGPIGV